MKRKLLGVLPASVPVKKIAKSDQEAQEAHAKDQEQAAVRADEALGRLQAAIAEGRTDTVKQELSRPGPSGRTRSFQADSRVACLVQGLPRGTVIMALVSGDGQALQEVKLAEQPVPATFVCGILENYTR